MAKDSISKRILVGVDGSDSSIDALREAAAIAKALEAPLEAVTAWEYPALVGYYPITDWSPEEDARTILTTAIDQAFQGAPPPDLTTNVWHGPPARVLIEQSRQSRMLVLGSRGRGGFVGMLLGSVSAACAGHAECPVLIVRSSRSVATDPDDAAEEPTGES